MLEVYRQARIKAFLARLVSLAAGGSERKFGVGV
jgi:hypothetical protein